MLIYVFVNMYNGRNIKKSCKKAYSNKQMLSAIIFAFVLTIIVEK